MQQSPRQRSTAVTARVQREGRYEHLAILVLQAISVLVSYCTLIQDFCDGGQRETLPDSSLRKNYPCSGSRHEKAAYILLHTPETLTDLVSLQYPDTWASFVNFAMLVRLPLALVLPHAIYERLTVAILFGVRLTPMTVHITRWLDPPPNQSALWFMTISPATELLTFYVANPVRAVPSWGHITWGHRQHTCLFATRWPPQKANFSPPCVPAILTPVSPRLSRCAVP